GVEEGHTPDWRMLRENGLGATRADADYFARTFPELVRERIAGVQREEILARILKGAQSAAGAYREFRSFVLSTFFLDPQTPGADGLKPEFRADRYSLGKEEYDWALKNNLQVEKSAAQLYEEAWPVVQATRRQMQDLAQAIGRKRGWDLPERGPAAVRAVFDRLSMDYPHSDREMVDGYRKAATRLVQYARKTGLFDVPEDYRLEVVETPPPLRASIDGAAYYPAPPFKDQGVGRFYVTPTGDDDAALKSNNRAAMADLAAHEGFPGHDWHFKVMTGFRDEISPVRWLTPGAVEDSSSMWEDSMAAEGWALYAEALMAEPQPGAPEGFYTEEEHLYQLQGQLYRDLRVRVDTGLHTGRLSFDEAVDLFSQVVDFLPGSCTQPGQEFSEAKRASCKSAGRAIFRYSKWPTQAITYRLGKDAILALRARAGRQMGDRFDLKQFHLQFMRQGTIPSGYFKDEFLQELESGQQAES
ncbi:MAG: DUF885 domain-containing protein, partial [Acidobacteriota bacterium]